MTERDRDDDKLSTEEGLRPHIGTNIGAVPGHGADIDISGCPGGSTGWGAWPKGMGTSDDEPDQENADSEDDDVATPSGEDMIGSEHGQLADSGVNTGPVSAGGE